MISIIFFLYIFFKKQTLFEKIVKIINGKFPLLPLLFELRMFTFGHLF